MNLANDLGRIAYETMREHLGHKIECAGYGPMPPVFDPANERIPMPNRVLAEGPWDFQNMAIECVECGELLFDADWPEDRPPLFEPHLKIT